MVSMVMYSVIHMSSKSFHLWPPAIKGCQCAVSCYQKANCPLPVDQWSSAFISMSIVAHIVVIHLVALIVLQWYGALHSSAIDLWQGIVAHQLPVIPILHLTLLMWFSICYSSDLVDSHIAQCCSLNVEHTYKSSLSLELAIDCRSQSHTSWPNSGFVTVDWYNIHFRLCFVIGSSSHGLAMSEIKSSTSGYMHLAKLTILGRVSQFVWHPR